MGSIIALGTKDLRVVETLERIFGEKEKVIESRSSSCRGSSRAGISGGEAYEKAVRERYLREKKRGRLRERFLVSFFLGSKHLQVCRHLISQKK